MKIDEDAETVDSRVAETIQQVLKGRLAPLGFKHADVQAGEDQDGDPVLFVDAYYRLTKTPFDPDATLTLPAVLRQALRAIGETRFPHVRHHLDEKQKVG
jgi:hypothetical protein